MGSQHVASYLYFTTLLRVNKPRIPAMSGRANYADNFARYNNGSVVVSVPSSRSGIFRIVIAVSERTNEMEPFFMRRRRVEFLVEVQTVQLMSLPPPTTIMLRFCSFIIITIITSCAGYCR